MSFTLGQGQKLSRALWNQAMDGLVHTEDFENSVQDIVAANLYQEYPSGGKGAYQQQTSTFKGWSLLAPVPVGKRITAVKVYIKPHDSGSLATQIRVRLRNGLANNSPIVATGTASVGTAHNVESEVTITFDTAFTPTTNKIRVDFLADGNTGFLGTTEFEDPSYNAYWTTDASLTVSPIPNATPTPFYLYCVWIKGGTGADVSANSVYGVPKLLVPKNIYVLKASGEQLNLYNRNAVTGEWFRYLEWASVFGVGSQLNDCFRLEPNGSTPASSGFTTFAAGNYALRVNVRGADRRLITSKDTTLRVVDTTTTTTIAVQMIGDSKTYGAVALAAALAKLSGTKSTVGMRKFGSTYAEGRSGWSLAKYLSAGNADGADSPFMFPIGVSAANYRGNVVFWKKVMDVENVVGGADTVGFGGFTEAAKGGGGAYIYNGTTGYPLSPTTGWVVYDPAQSAGSRFLEWNGSAWVAMAAQPSGYEMRYDKYLTRWGLTTPTHVIIDLMANDWFSPPSDALDFSSWIASYVAFVTNIRTYAPLVKICVGLSAQCSNQDAAGFVYNIGVFAERVRRNYQLATDALLTEFDTAAYTALNVYTVPMGLVVDPNYGFGLTSAVAPNKYSSETIKRVLDLIHPSDGVGLLQEADALAAWIQGTR